MKNKQTWWYLNQATVMTPLATLFEIVYFSFQSKTQRMDQKCNNTFPQEKTDEMHANHKTESEIKPSVCVYNQDL